MTLVSVNPASNFPFAPVHTKHHGGPGWVIPWIQIQNALVSYKKSNWVQCQPSSWGYYLQLCLEEKLLWTLCAVIDLVFLSMGRENMLLQLVCLNKHCNDKRRVNLGLFSFRNALRPWLPVSSCGQGSMNGIPSGGDHCQGPGGGSHMCSCLGLWLLLRCTLPGT